MDWLKQVFDFCFRNWRVIAVVLVNLVVLLVTIFKKRTKVNLNDFQSVLMALPDYINDAENKYGAGHGEDKFIYVYCAILNKLYQMYGSDFVEENNLGVVVQQSIEKILSTPTKKER